MPIDDSLATEALNLADGADIHNVAGMVAVYRSLMLEGLDARELERELRRYVVQKRVQRMQISCEASNCHAARRLIRFHDVASGRHFDFVNLANLILAANFNRTAIKFPCRVKPHVRKFSLGRL
jgi:hypothetical protein